MKLKTGYLLAFLLLFAAFSAHCQRMEEDTSSKMPFFKATKFQSACNVGVEAQVTQILKNKVGMNVGFNLNWVINHKFVVSAKYQLLTTRHNVIDKAPITTTDTTVYPVHHMAGLAFSYILFSNKKFSFQPELTIGWAGVKIGPDKDTRRHDYAVIIPAVYGLYNATKLFRVGIGLSYKAVIGSNFYGLKASDFSGVAGVVVFRVGTF